MESNDIPKIVIEDDFDLVIEVCKRTQKDKNFYRAIKKMLNISRKKVLVFLERMVCVVPDIVLEYPGSDEDRDRDSKLIKDFFQQGEGKIFGFVDRCIHSWFKTGIYLPEKNFAGYCFNEQTTLEDVIFDAKISEIYAELTIDYVHQICHRHFVNGENFLSVDEPNIFFVKNTEGRKDIIDPRAVIEVSLLGKEWHVSVDWFFSDRRTSYKAGTRFFLGKYYE